MDQGPYLIDTNVFVIDLRYPRDRNFGVNRRFLDAIKRERSGITTTINLLELCGILSFNLNQRQLSTLWEQFPAALVSTSCRRRSSTHRSRRWASESCSRFLSGECLSETASSC